MKKTRSGLINVLAISVVLLFCGCSGSKKPISSEEVVTKAPVAIQASPEEIASAISKSADLLMKSSPVDSDYKEVVKLLSGYESLSESPAALYEHLGEAHLYLAHFEKAEQTLAAGLQRDLYSRKIRDLLSNLNYVRGRLALESDVPLNQKSFFANALFYAPEDSTLSHNIGVRYTARVLKAYNHSQWELCSNLLNEATGLHVDNLNNYQYLARALLEQKQPLEALNAAERFLTVNSDSVPVLLIKGKALQQLERVAEAHTVFRKIEKLEPGNIDVTRAIRTLATKEEHVHWFNALAAIDDGQMQQAQTELELALKEVSPGDVHRQQQIYQRLAFVSTELNDYQRALVYVNNALSVAPDDITLNLEKGKILRLSQRLAEAKKVFEMLLNRFPENNDVKLATADFYLQLKLPGNAIPHLENLINDATEELSRETLLKALTLLGGCYATQKLYDKAEKAWHLLSEMEPDNGRVLFNLGLLYQNQNQYGKAIDFYERACSSVSLYNSNLARYLYGLAFAYRQNGQSELYKNVLIEIIEACAVDNGYRRRAYKSLIVTGWLPDWKSTYSDNATGVELFVKRGLEFTEAGDIEQAGEMYLQVLSFEPPASANHKATALAGLGLLDISRASYSSAAAFYMESLQLSPENGLAVLRLGQVFEKLELYEDSVEKYIEASRLLSGSLQQQALLQLATVYSKQKLYEKSLQTLDDMINKSPHSLLSSFAIRKIRKYEKHLLVAPEQIDELELRKTIRSKASVIVAIAEALAETGNGQKAREYIARAKRLVGNDREILLVEAHLLHVEGQSKRALSLLDEAMLVSPDDARILLLKSKIYFASGKMDKARELLEKIVTVDSSHFEAVAALSDVYQAEGKYLKARQILESLVAQSIFAGDREKANEKLKILSSSN